MGTARGAGEPPSGSQREGQPPPGTDEIAELWVRLRASADPIALLRETLARVVTEERERCAAIAVTAPEPTERMPWRYRLRFWLRPETMTRRALYGTQCRVAARIRADGDPPATRDPRTTPRTRRRA